MRTVRAAAATALIVLLGLAVTGCEQTTPSPEERTAIEQAVQVYLDHLAAAYSQLDASELQGFAAKGEIQSVAGVLHDLAASGDRVEAKLLHVEFEKVEIFRVVNATVKTMEVWDVGRFDRYSGREKGRNPSAVQHSIIQLRKIDGQWLVTARRVLETTKGKSRWTVPSPVPTPLGEETPAGSATGQEGR